MDIDLNHCVPQELAQGASLEDLSSAARAIEDWGERPAEVLDYIYRYRLIRLLQTRASLEELRALNEHIRRVLPPSRMGELDRLARPYRERWRVYGEILEARIHSLTSEAPAKVLERKHVRRILELVVTAPRERAVLKQALGGIGDPNLTRILKLMEANELIEVRRLGREKRIHLGPNGERFSPNKGAPAAGGGSEAPRERRGSSFFSLDSSG